jgi:16S rRNA (adenine1518-N6/adenine1519-N6)-dimethyltransferase
MIEAKKKYGQNFLKNKNVLENIADSVNVGTNDLIIEIGPGMGALTEYLALKGSYLICYEIDERMIPYLEKYNNSKTKIIYGDFLKRDIELDIKKYDFDTIYVIANIPYYITSPILTKLIESNINFKEIVLLVQKEFAERLTAKYNNKDYNALTLYVDYKYNANLLFNVSRKDFVPSPNVDSAVIKLTLKDNIDIADKDFYFKFIKDAFTNKRKTLKNNLKNYDWNKISYLLSKLGLDENVRAEQISPENFSYIVNNYQK